MLVEKFVGVILLCCLVENSYGGSIRSSQSPAIYSTSPNPLQSSNTTPMDLLNKDSGLNQISQTTTSNFAIASHTTGANYAQASRSTSANPAKMSGTTNMMKSIGNISSTTNSIQLSQSTKANSAQMIQSTSANSINISGSTHHSSINFSGTTPGPMNVNEKSKNYLKSFGYLKEGLENDEVSLEDAIKTLQQFAGLKQTGFLDDATLEVMEKSRCSLPDVDAGSSDQKSKRFETISKWKKFELGYKVLNYPSKVSGLSNEDVDRIIAESWKIWSDANPKLSFPLVESEKEATMKISFKAGNHSDKYNFDGKGGVLGHGFYPTTGIVHFDDDELWSDNSKEGKQLAWVAIHEFGHALGLGHSNVTTSLMFPLYTGYKKIIQLHQDDIDGIRSLYPN